MLARTTCRPSWPTSITTGRPCSVRPPRTTPTAAAARAGARTCRDVAAVVIDEPTRDAAATPVAHPNRDTPRTNPDRRIATTSPVGARPLRRERTPDRLTCERTLTARMPLRNSAFRTVAAIRALTSYVPSLRGRWCSHGRRTSLRRSGRPTRRRRARPEPRCTRPPTRAGAGQPDRPSGRRARREPASGVAPQTPDRSATPVRKNVAPRAFRERSTGSQVFA
jgi:hypothetical protein